MTMSKISLKLKKAIKLDGLTIGVKKITPVGTININQNGTYDVTNYNEAVVETPVPSGTLDITTNGQYDVTSYVTANVNCPTDLNWSAIGYSARPTVINDGYNYAKQIYDNWNTQTTNYSNKYYKNNEIMIFPNVDTSKITAANMMFREALHLCEATLSDCSDMQSCSTLFFGCSSLQKVKIHNLTKVTNISYMFYKCSALKELDLNNFGSNSTSCQDTFTNCESLITIPLFDTGKVTTFAETFYGCTKLVNVPIFNTSSVTSFSSMFGNCTSLSNESLNNIMKMCINATSYNGIKTLRQLGLTSTQATACQGLSNYADFITAGWATGY